MMQSRLKMEKICLTVDMIGSPLQFLQLATDHPRNHFLLFLRFWLNTNISCMTTTGPESSLTYEAYSSGNRTRFTAQKLLVAAPPGQMKRIDGGLAKSLNR